MLITKKICCTSSGMASRFAVITSSSPSPSPVRLSPLCLRPYSCKLPKKTAPRHLAAPVKQTAETSRSMSLPFAMSQPRPAKTWPNAPVSGKSTTVPFSMAKATFCRAGAPGICERMRFPSVGSRMSMKCWPSCAGSCTMRMDQVPPSDRTIIATASTSNSLSSMAKDATSLSFTCSRTCSRPFFALRRWPPLWAAMTKRTSLTCSGSFVRVTQITSSSPVLSPVLSSPE
mmetsp:Transcript_99124/g.263410  ORF Transcript_99124/g.263410 Transcript_99124/m.263410 type:complete len:230 (-) Transcript_99124:253-942(-)